VSHPVVGRLAPSPTGHLHLGHARSFLLAWWSARASGGRVVLRIEDLDRERSREEFALAQRRDLEWLGIDWDEETAPQSERGAQHAEALARLVAAGLAYPCVCTRRELAAVRSAPHSAEEPLAPGAEPPYPGTCRGRWGSREEALAATGREAAWRFQVPDEPLVVEDAVHGRWSVRGSALGDFPLTRRDGGIGYQLAVVVDDAADGVTEVLRGDDLLPSAARQALIYAALGLPVPRWVHVPLVHDAEGRRLAKRHDSLSLATLRSAGHGAGAVVAWAARSAGIEQGVGRSASELTPLYQVSSLPRIPVKLAESFP